uniref:Uncharacterized protein n=1 Tax=Rhizophora mucronata TaxID=61149 RepID=A0A2P2L5J9_RHIMU
MVVDSFNRPRGLARERTGNIMDLLLLTLQLKSQKTPLRFPPLQSSLTSL